MNKKTRKLFTWCLVVAMLITQMLFANVAFAATPYSGADRYQTALSVVKAGWTTSDNAVIAQGEDLADALAAAPLAYAKGKAPILLTDPKVLSAGVMDELTALGVKNVYIVGGTGAVSQAIEDALKAKFTVKRLAGADRAATSYAVAQEAFPTAPTKAVLVNGYAIADALSISGIAAYNGMPILLADKDSKSTDIAAYLTGKTVYAVGGTGVLSDANIGTATRLSGADRYATNVAVLGAFTLDYSKVFVAVGEDANNVDALGGAALAAKGNNPMVLVNTALPAATATFLQGKLTADSAVYTLGGAVSPSVATAVEGCKPVNTTLKVDSVSAINSKQLKVVFTQAVDETAAETPGNYYLNNVQLAAGTATLALQSDSKTVIITLVTALTYNATNVYQVEPIASASSSLVLTPRFSTTQKFADDVAPTVTKVTSSTNSAYASSLTVTYSEPVVSGIIKIDGTSYVASAALATTQTFTSLTLDVTKTHTLEYINLTDTTPGTHANATSYGSLTFNVTKDAVAPQVSSVAPYSDKQVLVTFSKEMDPLTVIAGNAAAADQSLTTVPVTGFAPLSTDTTGTQFILTLGGSFYSSSVTSKTVSIAFNGNIKDTLGNAMAPVTKSITLTQDTTAPAVTDIVATKNLAGQTTALVVKFNKGLTAVGAGVLSNKLTIVDNNGVLITAPGLAANSNAIAANATSVTFTFSVPAVMDVKWTVTVPAGLVTDTAETPNANTGYSKLVDMSQPASAATFTLAAGSATIASNVITVNYGVVVKGGAVAGSATDPNNYSINGTVLPAGTTITLDATRKIATITLPSGFITASDTNAVFRIANVQNSDSVAVTPYLATLNITDNVKPVLNAATLNADNSISVGFSETVTGLAKTDLVVKVNGSAVTLTPAGVTLAQGVGADAGKWVLNLNALIINDGTRTFIDMNGNSTYDAANDIFIKTEAALTAVKLTTNTLITSVTVGIIPTGTPTGADAVGNKVTNGTTLTVK